MSTPTTILLFGDQTDSWIDGIDQLYQQAASTPWLKSFLDQLADVINAEAKYITLDRAIQDSLGHFSSLQELGEKYRHTPDELGVVRCLLLHTVRAGTLLQWVKREPHLIGPRAARTEWLGISGGLLTLSALAVAEDFDSLHDACLEVGRLVVRVCKFTSVRSRAIEDQPGVWGWAILGIPAAKLGTALDQFQQSAGIPSSNRAKVGVTGAGWSTIIGPPSVLQLVITQCPAVRKLPKNPLEIKAIQHTLVSSHAEINYMVGHSAFLNRPLIGCAQRLWGIDDPAASYANWGDLLRAVCLQVLSRPLDITQVADKLNSRLDEEGLRTVRLVQVGSSSHAPYVASVLRKTAGKDVSMYDQHSLRQTDDVGANLKTGRIAIVGMAGRGPGSDNVEEFWDVIMSQQDLCQEVPINRFNVEDFYCPQHERGDQRCKMTTKYGCFMDKPGHFDSRFFHISPREAMLMDPGHRQFLMSTYEALEMAGYSDGQTRTTDPNRIAAFLGQCTDDWYTHSHPALGCDAYTLQGVQRAFGPGRLAWQFKWEGPTYSLDSACAGTTAAIHLAAMSLLSKDIDMAVAGAANILSSPHSFAALSDSGVLSDTGNCKSFRDDADGYCRGDFVGTVVLKRLEDAIAHNDNILAVVAASGRNHSGNSTSITTSDAHAQESLFRKVMRNAQVSPNDISYVEMHATGTEQGDPAEMGAVASTFKHRSRVNGPLTVGGVKANVGHSEAAAGIAELLKCIMMFQKEIIPPQAGMPHALNPSFPSLSESNIEILSEAKPFKKEAHQPRRILLNNFDAAGGNACMVLEDFTPAGPKSVHDIRSSYVVVSSGRTRASFHENKLKLAKWLKANSGARIHDVSYTTTARRMHHPFRFACKASSIHELIREIDASDTTSSPLSSSQPPVVFMFTGQGSHYAGMGSELYRTSPIFRETVDLCVAICNSNEFDIFLDIITNDKTDMSTKNTAQVQLAVVTLEIALTAFWRSAGVEPAMVMGHSLGEYAALYAAGVLSMADTLYLVGQRAQLLLERCEPDACAMLSLSISETIVRKHLHKSKSTSCGVACINGPSATVVSGTVDDLVHFQAEISAQDSSARFKAISVPFAFHSFQMDSILQEYSSLAGGVTYSPPKIPVASTLLGAVVDGPGIFNQDYLTQQTRQPVDFVGGLQAANSKLKNLVWLEIGPAAVCASFVRATLSLPAGRTMHSIGPHTSNWTSISQTLAAAYVNGVEIDWLALHKPYENNLELLTLPAYSWDMKDYWLSWSERGSDDAVSEKPQALATPQPFIATCAQYLVHKSMSPKIEVTLSASLSDPGFLALINGHKMQKIALASGSVFCDAAATAAMYAIEYSGRKDVTADSLTLHDPELLAPLTNSLVGIDGALITTAIMDSSSSNTISVSFKATSAHVSHVLGSIRVEISDPQKTQADWDRISYFVKATMDERIKLSKEGLSHRMQPEIIYALFANAVEFDPAFKGIQEAYIANDFHEAAAVVVLPSNPPGTRFTFSPYWGEALVHLAGFMVNGNPGGSPDTTFIVMGFGSSQQTVNFESGKKYLVYTRISRWEKETAYCDAFVFDPVSSKMIMQCIDLRYTELPRVSWRHILEGAHASSGDSDRAKRIKKVVVEQIVRSDTIERSEPSSPASDKILATNTKLFDIILNSISKSTGSDPSEFTNDTVIAELGVDSIMSIEIVAAVNAESDVELPASFIFDYPTIADLHRAFGGQKQSTKVLEAESSLTTYDATASSSDCPTPDFASVPGSISSSNSNSSFSHIEQAEATAPENEENNALQELQFNSHDSDTSPQPSVRITLLQGRPGSGQTPIYMMADGTGSIASYIHLPAFRSRMPVYGIDSPFLRCPSRLTSQVGIPGVAKLIVAALVKALTKGQFYIGGFSAGCMVAFEVCRQLGATGRKADGLVLIDLCCPRPTALDETAIREESKTGVAVFGAAVAKDGMWSSAATTEEHLSAYFVAMRLYNPPPIAIKEQPRGTAVIWAEKGMVNHVVDNPKIMKMLADGGIPTKAYPKYMEDPKLSPMACLIPDKTKADLGPNGWDRYTGNVLALSVDADHLDLPMPRHVHLLHAQLIKAFSHFEDLR